MAQDADPILIEIEAYLSATGMSPTTFGQHTINDPALVIDLRRGRELRRATCQRIRAYIDEKTTKRRALEPAR
jgi:hypothetical protein